MWNKFSRAPVSTVRLQERSKTACSEVKLGVMGVSRVSWRPAAAVLITILQIRALISVNATVVTGVEGQRFDFRCDYPRRYANHAKVFCHFDDDQPLRQLIRSEEHDRWEEGGRFALYDNTSGAFFTVRVDRLERGDGGTYCCGVDVLNMTDHIRVIKLNVSRVNDVESPPTSPPEINKLSLPLYLTTVACVSAMLFVCVFTFGLLLAVKNRRSGSRGDVEMSSDYESMMPGVRIEPEWRPCSYPGCTEHAAMAEAGTAFPHLTSKQRESAIYHGLSDYVDVDAPRCLCQYQHLDPSSLENHVYHSLGEDSDAKHEPSKETINSG